MVPRSCSASCRRTCRRASSSRPRRLPYASWAALRDGGIELVPRSELLENVRAVKEPGELDAIRRAAAITDECFARLAEERFIGRTEKELAWWLESLMHELGADGPAFEVIVAAGANGASPHASTGDQAIPSGTTVVVDAAARLDGYCSDCTRTFATGSLPDELARSYEVCLDAQRAALEAVRRRRRRPGRRRRRPRPDRRGGARRALRPRARPRRRHGDPRAPAPPARVRRRAPAAGVVTVEPGIYHPGLGGIRIEDLVDRRRGRAGGAEPLHQGAGHGRLAPRASRRTAQVWSVAACGRGVKASLVALQEGCTTRGRNGMKSFLANRRRSVDCPDGARAGRARGRCVAGAGRGHGDARRSRVTNDSCGADIGAAPIGSVTFTKLDKTTLRTAVRINRGVPFNLYTITLFDDELRRP